MCVTQWKANRTGRCPQVQPEGRSTKPGPPTTTMCRSCSAPLRRSTKSLGRVCQHYKVCLVEETQARSELGLALLLVTDVRAYSVQMVLCCGTKNAQSTAAARELFEERYRSSSPRQVAISLIKGVSVCTNCVGAPDWPTDFGDPAAAGLPLSKLKGEPLSSGYRPRRSTDQLSAFGAEDIVDMPGDALQVYCMCCVFPI